MITAPYNFVPLNKEVFYPSWSNDGKEVSHDIPFEDGESGEIDITITAKSPIFIRDHENPKEFCQHNGEYYIPSTSIKGMVRNVLEIMSFGEMRIDEKKLSQPMTVRDMSDTKKLVGVATGCGFLKQDAQGKWYIEDYGTPRTIEYTNKRDKTFNLNGKPYIFTLNQNNENMSAEEKYNLLGAKYFEINVEKKVDDLYDKKGIKIGTKQVALFNSRGEKAYLICTGEITNKEHEFVFASSDKKADFIKNIDDAVARFKTVYFESDSVDGNYWKHTYDKNIGIPIFYRKKDGQYDIGLTQLFKLLYPNTLKNAIKQTVKPNSLDLAHTLFGTEKEKLTLKGRVYFSHFKTTAKPNVFIENLTMTLGSPKPSFYPTYISQNCKNDGKVQDNNYHTLMQNGEIAGWKRYPLHHNKPNVNSIEKSDTTATFNPMGIYKQDGTFEEFSFTGKLRYHNLKPQELGAILSALTFHANQENFYHNIGLAKAHGFGKIAITVDTEQHKSALQAFEAMMTLWTKEKLKKEWIKTEQVKELFAMHYKETNIDGKLKYLVLDPDRRINQFSDVKNIKAKDKEDGRDCLPKYSVLSGFSTIPESLLNQEYIEQMKEKKEQEAQAKQEQEDFDQAWHSENLDDKKNFITKYSNHPQIHELKEQVRSAEEAKQNARFAEVDAKAKIAWELVQSKKGNQKQYQKAQDDFIKKWGAEKNNKKSPYILALVKQAKEESK
jgi:CRISPR-associated protein (TIGR03986 family)